MRESDVVRSCAIAHGIVERRDDPGGTVVFECMFCGLSVKIDGRVLSAKSESERNRQVELLAHAFFQEHR
jgi:hypothetical protein